MRFLLLLLVSLMCIPPAMAQQTKAKEPIEISADQSLEWHRENKTYVARDNAIAKQGATELHGDTLTAQYNDGPDGKSSITRIDAVGNVTIISDGSTATGDQGYYDVATGYSELTGNNLMLKTKTDTVTARDKITYDTKMNELVAHGNAKAIRGQDTITADKLIARFEKDAATGETKMKEMEGIGNVVITTATDTMHGEHGVYNAATNKAKMTGGVRIDRGPSNITGTSGEVDLNSNTSKIFGDEDAKADGRVRGVFYPE